MTLGEMQASLPKTGTRAKDFEHYTSKAGFCAEAHQVSESVREAVRHELRNVFTIDVHESGKFLVVHLQFNGKSVDGPRNKFITVNCDTLDCEYVDSIKLGKIAVRQLVAENEPAAPEAVKEEPKTTKPAKSKKTKKPAREPEIDGQTEMF